MEKRRWFDAAREWLSLLAPGGWGKLAWCARQRRRLAGPNGAVVWLRGEELDWATWGVRHGFFEVERMDGLPYLRVPVPADGGPRQGEERP
jgi:hypothetical protein